MKSGKAVKFSVCRFRLFDPAIGDNPSVSSGPPIGIGWTYYEFTELAVQMACSNRQSTPSGSNCARSRRSRRPRRASLQDDFPRRRPSDELLGQFTTTSRRHSDNDRLYFTPSKRLSSDSSVAEEPLAWTGMKSEVHSELIIPVDDYEELRGPKMNPIPLSREERECRLREIGYSREEIAQVVREVRKAKNRRRQTFHNLGISHVEEAVERSAKVLRRWLVVSNEKKEMMRSRHLYTEWKKKVKASSATVHVEEQANEKILLSS